MKIDNDTAVICAPEEPAEELERRPQLQEHALNKDEVSRGQRVRRRNDRRDERAHDTNVKNRGLAAVEDRRQPLDTVARVLVATQKGVVLVQLEGLVVEQRDL